MTRKSVCFALVAGALLIAPAAASAGSVTTSGGGLGVAAGFGSTTPHTLTVSYSAAGWLVVDSVAISAGSGCMQGAATSVTCADAGPGSVFVTGSAAGDTLTLDSVGPTVTGVTILGSNGSDTIVAREDSIANPGGPDGPDLLKGEDGDDTIDGGYGPDSVFGGRGIDTTTYANRPASQSLIVNVDEDSSGSEFGGDPEVPDGAAGEGDSIYTENVIGGAGNDVISGVKQEPLEDAGPANTFTGGGGNDRLLGGPGGDQLDGGAGNDKLFGGAQQDKLNGAAGRDRCVGGPSRDTAKKCESTASLR